MRGTGPSAPLWTAVGSGDAGPWPGGAVQRRCADIHRVLRAGQNFYLLTDSGVECFSLAGSGCGAADPQPSPGAAACKEGCCCSAATLSSCLPRPSRKKHIKGPLMFKNPSFLLISYAQWWLVLAVRYARKGAAGLHHPADRQPVQPAGAWRLSAVSAGWVFQRFLAGGLRTQVAPAWQRAGYWTWTLWPGNMPVLPASLRDPVVEACERSLQALLEKQRRCAGGHGGPRRAGTAADPGAVFGAVFVIYGLLRMLVSLLVTVLGAGQ